MNMSRLVITAKDIAVASGGVQRIYFGPFQDGELISSVSLIMRSGAAGQPVAVEVAFFSVAPLDSDASFSSGRFLTDNPGVGVSIFSVAQTESFVLPMAVMMQERGFRFLGVRIDASAGSAAVDGSAWVGLGV